MDSFTDFECKHIVDLQLLHGLCRLDNDFMNNDL